jgi:hypothetical protein
VLNVRNAIVGAVLLPLLAIPAVGQGGVRDGSSQCRQNLTAAEFLLPEDAFAAREAFISFRSALLDGDKKSVSEQIRFPLDVVVSGSALRLNGAGDLLRRYGDVFTPFTISAVQNQNSESLLAGWDGVSIEGGTVRFIKEGAGFRVGDITTRPIEVTGSVAQFLAKRVTCPPIIVEGRVRAYNWVSRMPGFENIYVDHLIVDVTRVLKGEIPQSRIRVDFWGVSHLAEYNLPREAFEVDQVWRMYLRPAATSPGNEEVCRGDVQEAISFVDEKTRKEVERQSAIVPIGGTKEALMTYVGLPCFEVHKQYFTRQADNYR